MNFLCPGFPDNMDQLRDRCTAHNGVIQEDDSFSFNDPADRIELIPHHLFAQLL